MGQLDLYLGVTLIGVFLNTYLYGLVSCQYWRYYGSKFKDRMWTKLVVLSLFVLDTTQTITSIWMMYNYTVTHFADPTYVETFTLQSVWPFIWSVLSNSINALLTQSVLSYRLYRLTKSRIMLGCFLSFATVAWCVLAFSQIQSFVFISQDGFARFDQLNKIFAASRVMDVVLDVSLTISLFYVLNRSRTGFERTDSIINTILLGAVKTGFFCMALSTMSIAIFLNPKLKGTMVFSLVAMNQGKVSTNVLLDSLLKRSELKKNDSSTHATSVFNVATQAVTGPTSTFELRVRKDVTTEVATDAGNFAVKNIKKADKDHDAFSIEKGGESISNVVKDDSV